MYDVTDPQNPSKLSEHSTDGLPKNALTDSAFAWDAGNAAYAVISAAGSTQFVILDITSPKHPKTIATHQLETLVPFPINQPALGLTETFITDIVVKQIGSAFMMLVTAGDAGHVLLDVTNPLQIVPYAQTDYVFPDPQLLERTGIADLPEGNAHHAEFTADNAFIIGVDADDRPYGGTTSGGFDGWGYVHLYSSTSFGGPLLALDTFAINEAHDPAYAAGFGILSVHEVAPHPQSPTRAYLAYRQGGFRAIAISNGTELIETGGYLGGQGNDIWGVEAFVRGGVTYILASDREKGLYIFRDVGAAL